MPERLNLCYCQRNKASRRQRGALHHSGPSSLSYSLDVTTNKQNNAPLLRRNKSSGRRIQGSGRAGLSRCGAVPELLELASSLISPTTYSGRDWTYSSKRRLAAAANPGWAGAVEVPEQGKGGHRAYWNTQRGSKWDGRREGAMAA